MHTTVCEDVQVALFSEDLKSVLVVHKNVPFIKLRKNIYISTTNYFMWVFFCIFHVHQSVCVFRKLPEQLDIAAVSDLFVCRRFFGYSGIHK